MNVITLLTVFLTLPLFFRNVCRQLYEEGDTGDNSYLSDCLSDATRSFDRMLNNFYIVIGSSLMASVMEPDHPEEKASRIYGEFESSFHQFSEDFRRLYNGIQEEKGKLSESSASGWDIAGLFPESLTRGGIDPAALSEWITGDDNPCLNNDRVFYHTMKDLVMSFAKRELGVKDLSLPEIVNDLSVSGAQLAGILGVAGISILGSIKVRDTGRSF